MTRSLFSRWLYAHPVLYPMIPSRGPRFRNSNLPQRTREPEFVAFPRIEDRTSKECAICRRSRADYEHTCGVYFHKSCIEQYFDAISAMEGAERICPHCQAPVPMDLDAESTKEVEVSPIPDEVYDQYLDLSDVFSMALIDGNIRDISVFVNSEDGDQYFVNLDFAFYPKKPTFSFPDDLLFNIRGLDELLENLRSWDEQYPPKLSDVMRDIQSRIIPLEKIPGEPEIIQEEKDEDAVKEVNDEASAIEAMTGEEANGFHEGEEDDVVEVYPEDEVVEVSPEDGESEPMAVEEILPAAFFDIAYQEGLAEQLRGSTEDSFENEEAIQQYLDLSNSYSIEMVDDKMYHVVAYLSCLDAGIYNIYPVTVNFREYPKKPMLTLTDDLLIRIRGLDGILQRLGHWDSDVPEGIVDILQGLEARLVDDSNIESELEVVKREYRIRRPSKNRVAVTIPTYGPGYYDIVLDLTKYPGPPDIILPDTLESIDTEELEAIKKWPFRPQKRIMDVLRSLAQTINYIHRPAFEETLLRMISRELEITENGYRVVMEIPRFQSPDMDTDAPPFMRMAITITLPPAYPLATPEFDVEVDDIDVQGMVQLYLSDISNNWSPSFFLADALNRVSLNLVSVSLFPCLICGQKTCPVCGLPLLMAHPDHTGDICEKPCIHCKRPYHIHCISDAMAGGATECGYCLTDLSQYF